MRTLLRSGCGLLPTKTPDFRRRQVRQSRTGALLALPKGRNFRSTASAQNAGRPGALPGNSAYKDVCTADRFCCRKYARWAYGKSPIDWLASCFLCTSMIFIFGRDPPAFRGKSRLSAVCFLRPGGYAFPLQSRSNRPTGGNRVARVDLRGPQRIVTIGTAQLDDPLSVAAPNRRSNADFA